MKDSRYKWYFLCPHPHSLHRLPLPTRCPGGDWQSRKVGEAEGWEAQFACFGISVLITSPEGEDLSRR